MENKLNIIIKLDPAIIFMGKLEELIKKYKYKILDINCGMEKEKNYKVSYKVGETEELNSENFYMKKDKFIEEVKDLGKNEGYILTEMVTESKTIYFKLEEEKYEI